MFEDRNALADEIERLTSAMSSTDHSESRAATGVLAQTVCLNAGIVLAALRSDAGAEMRERSAAICDHQSECFARAIGTDAEQKGDAEAALALCSTAILIRALPLTPTEDRRDA